MLSRILSYLYWFVLATALLLVPACASIPETSTALLYRYASETPTEISLSTPGAPPAGRSPAASATASPSPTWTPFPTSPPSITPTPTLTPHPMNILAMRQGPYPGSDVIIHEELDRGVNYSRYYASYESEGLTIYALLTVPDGDPPSGGWPAIVFNHGYIPPAEYRTTERYIAYVDQLARHGYIVFRIDYRGHDRSDGEPSSAYSSPGYTVDVLNAISALKRYPLADPERIGMWGHSMGGFLTLRGMVISPDVKVGVIWAGVVASYPDLISGWRRGSRTSSGPTSTPSARLLRSWRASWIDLYGTPEENPLFWGGVSANSYLAELSGPIQLHHGDADTDVPIEFSKTLYEQLLAAGKTAEFYSYEGDNHNISENFSLAMTRTLQFFDRYLKDSG